MKKVQFKKALVLATLMVGNMSYSQDITSDLILEMGFSNDLIDLTGNATPTPSGLETYVSDRAGNPSCALLFNGGATEYVIVPSNGDNSLVDGDDFTISFWFRVNNSDPSDLEGLFQKGSSAFTSPGMALYDINTPMLTGEDYYLWDDAWNADAYLPSDTIGWHHFLLVADSTSIRLYRDNVEQNFEIDLGGITFFGTGSEDYYVGHLARVAFDDLKVYRRALDVSEIDALYNLDPICASSGIEDVQGALDVRVLQQFNELSLAGMPEVDKSIYVFDLFGKEIAVENNVMDASSQMDLSSVATGVYIVRIIDTKTGESLYTQKFYRN